VLHENARLFGTAKLVAQPGDCSICRIDVPDDLSGSIGSGSRFDECSDDDANDAPIAWAHAVTALATGSILPKASAASPGAAVIAELKQAGWSASADGVELVVHVQLPGVYRQVVLTRDRHAGVTLAAELIELADLQDECLRAMLVLAQHANARLPLVRMAVADPTNGLKLRAEVGFGAALIPGSFLLHALHVIEAAIGLTARELEALRDVELARLVLSATSLRNSVTQPSKGDCHVHAESSGS
jgi:hypothetical protein